MELILCVVNMTALRGLSVAILKTRSQTKNVSAATVTADAAGALNRKPVTASGPISLIPIGFAAVFFTAALVCRPVRVPTLTTLVARGADAIADAEAHTLIPDSIISPINKAAVFYVISRLPVLYVPKKC